MSALTSMRSDRQRSKKFIQQINELKDPTYELAIRVKREPPVFVIDRVFRKAGRALSVQVSKTGQINVDLIGQAGRVLLVTSEVHSGNTMRLVSQELDEAGVTHDTFSFLVSPHSSFAVDRHILRSDHRGILPWPDAPAREEP